MAMRNVQAINLTNDQSTIQSQSSSHRIYTYLIGATHMLNAASKFLDAFQTQLGNQVSAMRKSPKVDKLGFSQINLISLQTILVFEKQNSSGSIFY